MIFGCKHSEHRALNSKLFQTEIYKKRAVNSKIKYLDSLQTVASQSSNDSILRNFLFDLSAEYYYQNENKKSFDVCKNILSLSKVANDTFSIAKSYSYIGDTFEVSDKDSAYYYYQKSEQLYRVLNNKDYIGKMLFKKAYILFFEGNYIESEAQVSKALLYLKDKSEPEMLFTAYSLLGLNFEKLEEYQNALKYQLLARSVLKDIKGTNSNLEKQYIYYIESTINISNIYEKMLLYDKSIQELQSILTPELKKKWMKGYTTAISNLGYSRMKSGNIEGVEKLFKEALSISIKNGSEGSVVYKLLNLGEYYSIVKDTVLSTHYLKRSYGLAQKLKMGEEIKTSLKLLSKIDTHNAHGYDKRYIVINDSLSKLQRINRNKYARIEYETSVVENENKLLNVKNTNILISAFILTLAFIFIIGYNYVKNQRKEIVFSMMQQKAEKEIFNLLKENQIKLSEAKGQEQNRISKELHDNVLNKLYGARMQLGILNDSDKKEEKEKRLSYVDLLQEIENEIRAISHDLQTDEIGSQFEYSSLLNNLIQVQNEIGETVFSFKADKEIDWMVTDSLLKITIFRIVQECLSNVSKHAKAKKCEVTVEIGDEKNSLKLTIKDDGIGFDVATKVLGIGLKNIKERVAKLNSAIEITSSHGFGTLIQITFFKVQL